MNIGNVIHLEGRPEHFKEELKAFGVDYNIIEGVKHEKGNIGVSLAFKKVIELNYDQEQTLIFEDDVKFTSVNSRSHWDKCVSELPEEWDILIGGSYQYDAISKKGNLIKLGDFSALHCVLINKKAYDSFLIHDPVNGIPHIDRHLGKMAQLGLINVYLCDPMIALQHPGYSHTRNMNVDYEYKLKDKNVLFN